MTSAGYGPGTLWPVNAGSVERVEGLFAINERLTTRLRLAQGGEALVVKVGATNVGRIAVSYTDSLVTNIGKLQRNRARMDWAPERPIPLKKGEELGRFEMGSTVILVVDSSVLARNPGLFKSALGKDVRVGEAL